jgi:tRNA threonylcarbamoyladenosine biosynthesis protein TsaE
LATDNAVAEARYGGGSGAAGRSGVSIEAGVDTRLVSVSAEETFEAGAALGRILTKGSVVALCGPLGAGKTCFCAGVCRALGVREPVTSPTYTIVHEYAGRLPVCHIDAYRLRGADDFEGVGGRELLDGNGVSLIEWSDIIEESLPPDAIRVGIEIDGDGRRVISVRWGGVAEYRRKR